MPRPSTYVFAPAREKIEKQSTESCQVSSLKTPEIIEKMCTYSYLLYYYCIICGSKIRRFCMDKSLATLRAGLARGPSSIAWQRILWVAANQDKKRTSLSLHPPETWVRWGQGRCSIRALHHLEIKDLKGHCILSRAYRAAEGGERACN